ncbi:MAG TPA: hypothetical protein VK206_28405 [Anaerolineales bacterium]|nr:hypothetical protein [Anaerolineales bacterium]
MAKQSLVLELQQLATDGEKNIVDLLRKALLVATKLNLTEFRDWIRNELNGYEGGELPSYRKCHAEVKGKNPFHGLIPIGFPDNEFEQLISTVPISNSVSGLYDLIENANNQGTLYRQMPIEAQRMVSQLLDAPFQNIEVYWVLQRSQIVEILDAVRNTILEWSLRLESEGILGDGLSFSDNEKQKASSSTVIQHVETFNLQGVLGSVTDSIVTQNLQMTVQKNDLDGLRNYLYSLKIDDEDIQELEDALQADPKPKRNKKFGEKVSAWMGKMVQKAASGGWEIGVAVAGQLLANAISSYYGIK